MNIAALYRQAAQARLVYSPDRNALQRARRAYRRNLAEPGDCKGDLPLLAGLAIAQAQIGIRAGWISEVQALGCKIADVATPTSVPR